MNNNSVLCRFIKDHKDNWEELLYKCHGIKVKREGCYAIFNYSYDCLFQDPLVQEARGIIIDCDELEVICWPFRKFGNHYESYADKIDWSSARVLEKVDGSIIKLWFDKKASKWQFSTNGTIRSENASVGDRFGLTYYDVILSADNYHTIPFDKLDETNTYIFELVSPETKVLVKYDRASLYHIGTRNNTTGIELDVDIGIKKPREYPIDSLESCLKAAAMLNKDNREELTDEGFVVVDKNWNRVKIKSPDYLMINCIVKNYSFSKKEYISMVLENSENIKIISDCCPGLIPFFKYYEFKIAELMRSADRMGELARCLYKEYSNDRGAVAAVISKHPLGQVGFKCLDCNEDGHEVLMKYYKDRLEKLIPEYFEPDDLHRLFYSEKQQ